MFGFLIKRPSPKQIAKNRLKLIIFNDRGNLNPRLIDIIKIEFIDIITKYIDVNVEEATIKITNRSDGVNENLFPSIIANIPIKTNNYRF